MVEGERTDARLMRRLFRLYGIYDEHNVVTYKTNIYHLYRELLESGDPDSLDLPLLLRERERDPQMKELLSRAYSEILLVFDMDPQDNAFSEAKLRWLVDYFSESTEHGKLYLNYPMVESFYHMKTIPDPEYPRYTVRREDLTSYKKRVQQETREHNYQRFAASMDECTLVIRENIQKANMLVQRGPVSEVDAPDSRQILEAELSSLRTQDEIAVLCTCVFYVASYNPSFLKLK